MGYTEDIFQKELEEVVRELTNKLNDKIKSYEHSGMSAYTKLQEYIDDLNLLLEEEQLDYKRKKLEREKHRKALNLPKDRAEAIRDFNNAVGLLRTLIDNVSEQAPFDQFDRRSENILTNELITELGNRINSCYADYMSPVEREKFEGDKKSLDKRTVDGYTTYLDPNGIPMFTVKD